MLAGPAAPVPPAPPASTRTLVLQGTAPKGATTQILATPPATVSGLPTGAEEATKEAEGMAEAAAMAESVAAATSWEVCPAEGGGGPGTAGKADPGGPRVSVQDESPDSASSKL